MTAFPLSAQHNRLLPFEAQAFQAIDKLHSAELWLDMFAENVLYRGGVERYFQRSLLWAFNTIEDSTYWTDVEQSVTPLSGSQQIDFLVYRRTPENIAEVWADDKLPAHRWLEIGDVFCEMKCYYNHPTIESDLTKFRAIAEEIAQQTGQKKYFYELLLFWSYFYQCSEQTCLRALSAQEEKCWLFLKTLGLDRTCQVGDRWLLQGRPNPSDSSMMTYCKVVLLAMPV